MSSDQKNALFAVVLSALILFGWQYYFAPSAPAPTSQNTVAETVPVVADVLLTEGEVQATAFLEIVLKSNDSQISFDSSLSILDFHQPQSQKSLKEVTESKNPQNIEFSFGDGPWTKANFSTVTSTPDKWEGFDEKLQLKAFVQVAQHSEIRIVGEKKFKYRINFKAKEKKLENGQERKFAFFDDGLTQSSINSEEDGDTSIEWAGIDYNFHLFALAFNEPKSLLYKADTAGNFYVHPGNYEVTEISYHLYLVRKELAYLDTLGHNLKMSVDFGMWGFLAVWILKGLQFFYTFIPNYGVSILLLTFLVRLITFPLQYKSVLGMKKLQEIQPELTKIREKYKEDPMRLQKESMDLFKRSGANPMGGCLPILLQMPIFLAFYKVLNSAVELVDAPFMLWINDLSNKDPYYVIPVLMGLAMFLQQKMTPTTVTDPMQKKIFLFMPLIFSVMMKDLPSGLTLYFFFSTLLGILQQMAVFKMTNNKSKSVVV